MGHIRKSDLNHRRFFYFLIFFLFISTSLFAQKDMNLVEINEARNKTSKAGMAILGFWAILNIVSSPIGASLSQGSQKYFFQMNGYWNIVNLGLAGFGFYNAVHFDPSSLTLYESLEEQKALEKLLLFNAGFDLAYITGGAYLIERSRRNDKRSDLYKGFGQSLILQGAFLFAFDLSFYAFVQNHSNDFIPLLQSFHLGPNGFTLNMKF